MIPSRNSECASVIACRHRCVLSVKILGYDISAENLTIGYSKALLEMRIVRRAVTALEFGLIPGVVVARIMSAIAFCPTAG
jgi:hypothetical protein